MHFEEHVYRVCTMIYLSGDVAQYYKYEIASGNIKKIQQARFKPVYKILLAIIVNGIPILIILYYIVINLFVYEYKSKQPTPTG